MFEIINQTGTDFKELEDIRRVLKRGIELEEAEDTEFNVIIVDNAYIHKLNREYRNIDRVTDVITFALEDYIDMPPTDKRLLGDIYISLEKAQSQAIEYGHSLQREICFLAVHGFLHLLGYDHMVQAEEDVMFDRQELILNAEGIQK